MLDPNVLIAAILSPRGAPAALVLRFLAGEYELVCSEAVLAEVERALAYPKLRQRVGAEEAGAFVAMLRRNAPMASDPETVPSRSADPNDDYLLALAEQERAILVSGDKDLLDLADSMPVLTPQAFRGRLDRSEHDGG